MLLHDNLSLLNLENKQDIQTVIEKTDKNVCILHIYLSDEQYFGKKERLKNNFLKDNVKYEGPMRIFEDFTHLSFSGANERLVKDFKMTSMDLSKFLADGLEKPLYPLDSYWATSDNMRSNLCLDDDSLLIIKIHNDTSCYKPKKVKKDKVEETEPEIETREETKEEKKVVEDEEEEEEYYEDESYDEDETHNNNNNNDDQEIELTKDGECQPVKNDLPDNRVDEENNNNNNLPFPEKEAEKYIMPMVLTIIAQYVSMDKALVCFSGFKATWLKSSVKFIKENTKYDAIITPEQMIKDIDLYYTQNAKKNKPERELRIRHDCAFKIDPDFKIYKELEMALANDEIKYNVMIDCVNKLIMDNDEVDNQDLKLVDGKNNIDEVLYKPEFYMKKDDKIRDMLLTFENVGLKIDITFESGESFSYILLEDFIKSIYSNKCDQLLSALFVDIYQHTNGGVDDGLRIGISNIYELFDSVTTPEKMRDLMSCVEQMLIIAAGSFYVDNEKPPPTKKRKMNKKYSCSVKLRPANQNDDKVIRWMRLLRD